MTQSQFQRVQELFLRARQVPAGQREAFLEENCDDPAVRREVLELLAVASADTPTAVSSPKTACFNMPPVEMPPGHPPDVPGYAIAREIGRGGQAVVFEATQHSTGRRVALKLLKDGALADPSQRARFDREAQILAALEHPSIVTLLDRGRTAGGHDWIAMPFIDGWSLDEYLQREQSRDPNPASALLNLFVRIADAVNAAHVRGVVHRDLKPSNIRIDERGDPYVLDFGLARHALLVRGSGDEPGAAVTVTGQFLGSLPWASPEQASGNPDKIDVRSDVYSLGVMLYQILTGGSFPYEVVGNIRDVMNNILTAEPTPPSKLLEAKQVREARQHARLRRRHPAQVNPVIEAIVLKALAKRRDSRYQSAGELARDVVNYLSGRPTIAAGIPGNGGARLGFRGAAALSAVAVVALAVGAFLWKREPAAPSEPVRLASETSNAVPNNIATPSTDVREDAGETILPPEGVAVNVTPYSVGSLIRGSHPAEMLCMSWGGPVRSLNLYNGQARDRHLANVREASRLAQSPDGVYIAVGSRASEKPVEVFELHSGKPVVSLKGLNAPVQELHFGGNNRVIACAKLGTPIVWDIGTGQVVRRLSAARTVSISPDGRRAALAIDASVEIWDIDADRLLTRLTGHADDVASVAFAPDGQRVASGSGKFYDWTKPKPDWPDGDYSVRIWDVRTGKQLREMRGHKDLVYCLRFSPDSRLLASGGWDGRANVWDTETGENRLTVKSSNSFVESCLFLPEKSGLLIGSGGGEVRFARIPDAPKQLVATTRPTSVAPPIPAPVLGPGSLVTEPATLPGVKAWSIETKALRGYVSELRYAPSGQFVMVASWDAVVRLFDREGNLQRVLLGSKATHVQTIISADSKYVATSGEDEVLYLWEASTGRRLPSRPNAGWRKPTPRGVLTMTDQGISELDLATGTTSFFARRLNNLDYNRSDVDFKTLRLAVAEADDVRIGIFEAASGAKLASIPCGNGKQVPVLAGDRLITYSDQAVPVRLWDVPSGKLIAEIASGKEPHGLPSFTPDGTHLVADVNGRGHMWEAATGKELKPQWGEDFPLGFRPAFSPDGKVIVSGGNNELYWGDAERGVVTRHIRSAATNGETAVLLPPHRDKLVVGSWTENFRCWQQTAASTGKGVRIEQTLISSPGGVVRLGFSADGTVLISDSNETRLRIWDTAGWQQRAALNENNRFQALAASPDGSLVADAVDEPSHVRVVDVASGTILLETPEMATRVCAMAFSDDGQTLAVGGEDGSVNVIRPRTGETVKTLQAASSVTALAFAHDGARLATIDATGTIGVFELAGGASPAWRVVHPSVEPDPWQIAKKVSALAWSKDGGMLVSMRATTARRWDTHSGRLLSVATVPTLACEAGFSNWLSEDGSVATTIINSMLRVWDPATGRCFMTLWSAPFHNEAWMAISPDGHYSGSAGVEDEIVYVVETDAGQETLSVADFSARYGWKNDPSRVSLIPTAATTQPMRQ